MLSYIKSECYRIVNNKSIYLFTFLIAGFALSINLLLFAMNHIETDFPYGTVRFSLSNLIMLIYLVVLSAGILAALLYADDRKNGTMKNVLLAGLSRTQLFTAKCIICSIFGLISMTIILLVYLGSAVFLLEGPATEAVLVLLQGIVALLPTAVAAVVLAVASFHFIQSANWAQIFWISILFAIPIFLHILGLYFEPLAMFASWIPSNIFLYEVEVTMASFDCVWQTDFGMMKCVLTGILSLMVFTAFGLWRSNKMEF